MGALIVWLHEDCKGDQDAHNALWEVLPHATRAQFRKDYKDDVEMKPLFDKERDPRGDEPDGEPSVSP